MKGREYLKRPITQAEFQELRLAGMELYKFLKQSDFKIRADSQKLPDHLGIPDLAEEVNTIANTIMALAVRFNDHGPEPVSWDEYLDAKVRAQTVLEIIRNSKI